VHSIKAIREQPEAWDRAVARRRDSAIPPAAELLDLYAVYRAAVHRVEVTRAQQGELAERFRETHKRDGYADIAADLRRQAAELKMSMAGDETDVEQLGKIIHDKLSQIPALLDPSVPDGGDPVSNVVVRTFGAACRSLGFTARQHFEIGESLGMMDFKGATRMSGSRFVVLTGPLARLERALTQFMLDTHSDVNGYTEVNPPLLVRDAAVFGTGQLPKFSSDLFMTSDGLWLIPTAEVPLTNTVAGRTLHDGELPLRLVAATPCFRSEAGAAGRDTRGMIRQHQFTKVELVSVVTPEAAQAEHERMTACAELILEKLGLPFRTMLLCAGDTGFSARKTYDIEVWLPGQNAYREISSCSWCGDFQARRMNARYMAEAGGKPQFVHTLNGSGVAVGRALVAVLENNQTANGSVDIPEVLWPYMGGLRRITGKDNRAIVCVVDGDDQ
jgi:seryl-tRNA synthetase